MENYLKRLQKYALIKHINGFWQTNYLFATSGKFREKWYLLYRIETVELEDRYRVIKQKVLEEYEMLLNVYAQLQTMIDNL